MLLAVCCDFIVIHCLPAWIDLSRNLQFLEISSGAFFKQKTFELFNGNSAKLKVSLKNNYVLFQSYGQTSYKFRSTMLRFHERKQEA